MKTNLFLKSSLFAGSILIAMQGTAATLRLSQPLEEQALPSQQENIYVHLYASKSASTPLITQVYLPGEWSIETRKGSKQLQLDIDTQNSVDNSKGLWAEVEINGTRVGERQALTTPGVTFALGNTLNMSNNAISNLKTPVNPTDAASKSYVDNANVASATALNANGSNCASGQYSRGVDASGNAESCSPDLVNDSVDSSELDNLCGTDGKILKRASGSWACADDSNTQVSEATVESYIANDVTTGYVPYDDGVQLTSSGIYWDGLNSKMGLGTASPSEQLDMSGSINLPDTDASSSGQGIIFKNNSLFIHNAQFNGTRGENTFVGYLAGQNIFNDCTNSNTFNCSFNTVMGYAALGYLTTGWGNTTMGAAAMSANNTGKTNTGIGMEALKKNTAGNNNVAVGAQSLYENLTSSYNVAVGSSALSNTTGEGNIGIGNNAFNKNSSGKNNTVIGTDAGSVSASPVTGDNNILLGYNTQLPSATTSNHLNIGNTLYGDLTNKFVGIAVPAPKVPVEVASLNNAVWDTSVSNYGDIQVTGTAGSASLGVDSLGNTRLWSNSLTPNIYLGNPYDNSILSVVASDPTTTPATPARINVEGEIWQYGGLLHADYVFQPEYSLESIEEHAQFMWQEKHLKAVPKAQTDAKGREAIAVGAHRRGMLEELEKAHIYIEQLNRESKAQQQQIALLKALVCKDRADADACQK